MNREIAEHPDVRLLVKLDQRAGKIGYVLMVGSGASESFGLEIQGPLDGYFGPIYSMIEGLSDRAAGDPQIAEGKLAGISEMLCRRLLPEGLRAKLYALAVGRRLSSQPLPTLYLESDECSIPWELLRLPEPEGISGGSGGVFLVEAFALTRWFGHRQARFELPLEEMALVVSRDGTLKATKTERAKIQDLFQKEGHRVTEVAPTFSDVVASLGSGTFDGWHFSGHGSDSAQNPDLQNLHLTTGQTLSPTDLEGKHKLAEKRPLVFLNACKSGRGGFSLTGIGGWAEAFLGAGAGAFIGAHWALPDAEAAYFAKAFYERFLLGVPMAEAARHARLELRERFPGDPTWLAYTVFAHPLASCQPHEAVTTKNGEVDSPKREIPGLPTPVMIPKHQQVRPWIWLGLVVAILIAGWVVTPARPPRAAQNPQTAQNNTPTSPTGTDSEKPAPPPSGPPPPPSEPPELTDGKSETKPRPPPPTVSSKTYRVQLVLPTPLEQPAVLVDGKQAVILESTPTVVTVQIPSGDTNHKFQVISQQLTCQATRFISENTRIPLENCR